MCTANRRLFMWSPLSLVNLGFWKFVFAGQSLNKMTGFKIIVPLLGFLFWIMINHAGIFVMASLLPRPSTTVDGSNNFARLEKLDTRPVGPKLKINTGDLNRSVSFGIGIIERLRRLETSLGWSDIQVKQGTPAHGQLIESAPESQALDQGKAALIASKASIHLLNKHCLKHKLSSNDCAKHISTYKLTDTLLGGSCSVIKTACSIDELFSKYRSIDGSCNHISDGSRGQSFTSYKRLLFPNYLDGIHEPRRSVYRKKQLTSPRKISTELAKNRNVFDQKHTLAVAQWTQFISHDLTHTVTSKMIHSGKTIECCSSHGANLSPRYVHPLCAPISIPADDKFYSKHNLKCMSYVRSLPAIRPDCNFGPFEQLNQATHFLDASQIYGSAKSKAKSLRTFEDGLLRTSNENGQEFLPFSNKPKELCQVQSDFATCFVAGDSRVNTQPQLTAMHTVWAREHNRLAKQLKIINPHWNDEALYQEARRIVIAEIQHITYYEWLPIVLGPKYVLKMYYSMTNLDLDDVDPSISNSFATAAFRFYKSLVDDRIGLYTENRRLNTTLRLSEHFNKPMVIENSGYLDALIRGIATQSSQKLDWDYVKDITSQLYGNGVFGFDTLSLDIQRGRDHGLPSYTSFRSLCGLHDVKSFQDFLSVMPAETVKSLSRVYKDPHDVDLLVGGISENSDDGSLLGPTFSCIIADQFIRTRLGDRFFYTYESQPEAFTKRQQNEIEKVTLARIFCDNGDNIQTMQRNVFKKVGSSNDLVKCDSSIIPSLNLNYWLE